jgi:hypothetical protein
MQVENFVVILILSIIIPVLYIRLVSGFVSSIVDRLINANFELTIPKVYNLFIGYGVGALLFSYIFHQFFKYQLISIDEIANSNLIMPFLALSFCYIARVITRRNGRFSGRIYIGGVTAFASLIFLINTAIGLKSLKETPEGLFNKIYIVLNTINTNLIERIITALVFIREWIPTLVLGSLSMAIFGEFVVTNFLKPNIRSLPSVLEKFPSDFLVITGNNEIETKMKEMTSKKDVFSVKCITNTYRAFDIIHSNLETQWRILSKKGIRPDYRIIGSSEQEINQHLMKNNFLNLGKFFQIIYKKILPGYYNNYLKNNSEEINHRILKLKEMSDDGKIQYIEKSFGRFRMLLINDDELMFTVLGGNNEKIGLYTKEKYIIQFSKNLFENVWVNHNTPNKQNIKEFN